MRPSSLLCAALACLPACASAEPSPDAQAYRKVIRRYQKEIPRLMEAEGILGLSVALVDREGVLWAQGFGWGDRAKTLPVTPETLFSLQSNSKTVTSVAILVAVQKGLLDLDAPITRYLPDFRVQSRWEEHPERKMTLRHLLSHTAGFTHEAPVGNNGDWDLKEIPFEAHIRSLPETWLKFPVGERFSYSNLGIDLAGHILQVVSGEPFEEVVRKTVLEPLGMADSSFDLDRVRKAPNRAFGYDADRGENPVGLPMIPAGGLFAGAADMARFVQFHLNLGRVGGKRVLEERLLREMYAVPFAPEGFRRGYALGICNLGFLEPYCMTHGGGGCGFKSDMMWLPEQGLGVVILTNKGDHRQQSALALRILKDASQVRPQTPRPPAPPPEPVQMPPEARAGLAGTYGGGDNTLEISPREDGLAVRMPDGKSFPLVFTSRTAGFFLVEGERVPVAFCLGRDGAPRHALVGSTMNVFVRNPEPQDGEGAFQAAWEKHVGDYEVSWKPREPGKPFGDYPVLRVHRKNGGLWLDAWPLSEFLPGLFFTPDGEALDFRGSAPTFRNLPLRRKGE